MGRQTQSTHNVPGSWNSLYKHQNTHVVAYAGRHFSKTCWTARQGGKGLSSIKQLHDKGNLPIILLDPKQLSNPVDGTPQCDIPRQTSALHALAGSLVKSHHQTSVAKRQLSAIFGKAAHQVVEGTKDGLS